MNGLGKMVARLLCATLFLGMFAVPAFADTPTEVIQESMDLLDEKLAGHKEALGADREQLYAVIDSILLPRFDRKYAAQLVLGKYWRQANAEQRERFVAAFYRSLLQRYADGVLEFDQSRIELLPFNGDLAEARTRVKTLVTLDDGTKVPVDYALVNRDGNWLVFDVRIEGISYVQNFRAELNSEIQAKSLDAVIDRLESEVVE
jgi:phospholipid transport system substrate-binding protein